MRDEGFQNALRTDHKDEADGPAVNDTIAAQRSEERDGNAGPWKNDWDEV